MNGRRRVENFHHPHQSLLASDTIATTFSPGSFPFVYGNDPNSAPPWTVSTRLITFSPIWFLVCLSKMSTLQREPTPLEKKLIDRHPLQRLESPSRGVSAVIHVRTFPASISSLLVLILHIPL
jgi:hypothetical protein